MKNLTKKLTLVMVLLFTMSFNANSQEIGDIYEGGYLFYIDETAENGLVAALEDLPEEYEWGCYGTNFGADLNDIGAGYQNTLEIGTACSESFIAASEALAYESGGYDDWYLPSRGELLEMYNTIGNGGPEGNLGGFQNDLYWSSSEEDDDNAWVTDFEDGSINDRKKTKNYRVRVIRSVSFLTEGCTDATAFNYNAEANTDDGSCVAVVEGCTDATAFNYNVDANTDDASCEDVVIGCTDATAFNYNADANTDDGSCIEVVNGCTDASSFNYNADANTDDGTCVAVVEGCMDETASNYNSNSNTDDGSCISWEEYANDLQAQLENVVPEDGIGQADVDAAFNSGYDDGVASVLPQGCDLVEFESWPTNAVYGSTVSIASPNQWSFTQPGYEAVVIQGNGDQLIVEYTNLDGSYKGTGVGGYWNSIDDISSSFGLTVAPNILPKLESNEFVANQVGAYYVTASSPNPTPSVTPSVLQNNSSLVNCVQGDIAACEDAASQLNFNGNPFELTMNSELEFCVNYGEDYMCEMVIEEYFNESCSSVQSISINEISFTQAEVDAAYAEGAASVTPEDGVSQADVDAAYANGAASVEIPECEEVATQNIPLDLPQGWSMFGYTCLASIDVVDAFSDISNNLEIVKDEWGLAYLPEWGYSAFDNLEFGEGYLIKMTEEVIGFSFCSTLISTNNEPDLPQIGDYAYGGIVFQVNQDGTGLVADLQDLTSIDWGESLMDLNDAINAASVSSSQGYEDWYIPSKEELEYMYQRLGFAADNIGSFDAIYYWSTDYAVAGYPWLVNMSDGDTGWAPENTNDLYGARAIRAF